MEFLSEFLNLTFLFRAFSIVLIDILLAGDNAIVIAMAVRALPQKQRRIGLAAGAGGAIVLRIILTFFAARILEVSYLKLGGGVLILWIAVKLLVDTPGKEEHQRAAVSLRQAIWLIFVADTTMSLDNILAVAATSKGNLPLLIFGLGLSITFVVVTSNLLARLMDRYRWLIYLGAALLGRVGGDMMVSDPAMEGRLHPSQALALGFQMFCAVGVLAVAEVWKRRNRRQRALTPN
jgi:YjbE family integral membrane protein